MKGVRFIAGTVFQMETIVFDEPLNAGFVHETVVLFRAVSGVGDDPFLGNDRNGPGKSQGMV